MNKQSRPKSLIPIIIIGLLLMIITMLSVSAITDVEHWFNNTLVGTGNTWVLAGGSTAYTVGFDGSANSALLFNQSNYYDSSSAYNAIDSGEDYFVEVVFRCVGSGLRDLYSLDSGNNCLVGPQFQTNNSIRFFSRDTLGTGVNNFYDDVALNDWSWHYLVNQRDVSTSTVQNWVDGLLNDNKSVATTGAIGAGAANIDLGTVSYKPDGCSVAYLRLGSNEKLSESIIIQRAYYFTGVTVGNKISAFNNRTGQVVSSFNVTLTNVTGSYEYDTTTGIILLPDISGVFDVNITSTGFVQLDYDEYDFDSTPIVTYLEPVNHTIILYGYLAFSTNTIPFNVTVINGNYSAAFNNSGAYKNITLSLWSGNYSLYWQSPGMLSANTTEQFISNDFANNYFGNGSVNVSVYNGSVLYPAGFNVTFTDTDNNNYEQSYESGIGWLNVSLYAGQYYYVFIDAPPFAYNNKSLNASIIHQNLSFYLELANSVNVSVYDESNNSLIDWANVTLTASYESGNEVKVTTNGTAFFYELPVGTVSIRASTPGYVSRTYSVTVTDRSYQAINIYLASGVSNVTFTVKDFDTNVPLVTAGVTMERLVGGSWVVITSQYTDISGTVLMSYVPDTRYRFTVTKSGYTSRQFILDPIIYDAYTIQLTSTGIPTPPSQDYGVSVLFSPTLYYDDRQNNFSISFLSPSGALSYYNYTITYPGGYFADSGTNAVGGTLMYDFNISGAVWGDTVNITYDYIQGVTTFSFSRSYSVIVNATAGTLVGLKDNTYGLGLYERVIIITLLIILIGGFISLTLGVGPGLIAGMFMAGIGAAIGFLPLWASAMMFVVGLFVLMMQGRAN